LRDFGKIDALLLLEAMDLRELFLRADLIGQDTLAGFLPASFHLRDPLGIFPIALHDVVFTLSHG
jgi:hypothetical protein